MYEYRAKVVRWVDADTVVLDVDLGFQVSLTEHYRLFECWAKEAGTPAGDAATARVNALMPPGTECWINTKKAPVAEQWQTKQLGRTFTRWLAVVYMPHTNTALGDVLIAEGHATRTRTA